VLAAALIAPAAVAAHEPSDIAPDLDQLVPSGLVIDKLRIDGLPRFRLGFSSAAANVGAGPLTLHGYRESEAAPTMRVDQLVDRSDGPRRLVRDVGEMSYVVHPDHKHWHLLGFERYELRDASGTQSLGTDRKTGFCLGDRYAIPDSETLPGFSPAPLQGDTCGLGRPDLTSLFAGISVGWADRYAPQIEGQYIDITSVRTGNYVLVHRLNTDSRIVESDFTNNASSVRFSLRWNRQPRIKIIRRCPDSAMCRPPRLSDR